MSETIEPVFGNSDRQTRDRRKYRRIATECFKLALVVKEPRDRCQLLELAGKWCERAGHDANTHELIAKIAVLKGRTT